jgi:hypothetical protein
MDVDELRESEYVASVTEAVYLAKPDNPTRTDRDYGRPNYWLVTPVPGAYDTDEGVAYLCGLNTVRDVGGSFLVPKGAIANNDK